MYLERILGSKTKVNTLSALVENPERRFMESELATEVGSSVSEVNRQLGTLVNVGLVQLEREGRSKFYRINTKHFLYTPLRSLLRSLETVYREAARMITQQAVKEYAPITVILFGSLATGRVRADYAREPSDIDIVIVVDSARDPAEVAERLRRFVEERVATKYGIIAYPIVLSRKEYLKGLHDNAFIIDVHARGRVMYGEKPRRFS